MPYGTVTAMVWAASVMTPVAAGLAKLKAVIALEGSFEKERTARTLYMSPLNRWYERPPLKLCRIASSSKAPCWEELQ